MTYEGPCPAALSRVEGRGGSLPANPKQRNRTVSKGALGLSRELRGVILLKYNPTSVSRHPLSPSSTESIIFL